MADTTTTTTSRKQLQAAQTALAAQRDQVGELERQLGALDARDKAAEARLQVAERAIHHAETALQRANDELRRAQAAALIATSAGDDATPDATQAAAEGVSAGERTLAEAQRHAAKVAGTVKRDRAQIADERVILEKQRQSAAALHDELQRQVAKAHAARGRDELQRIGDEYVQVAAEMGRAYAALETARTALGALEAGLGARLAEWPDLRGEIERHAPIGSLRSFDTLSAWATLYAAHVEGCGKMAAVPVTQQGGTLARLQMANILRPYGNWSTQLQIGIQNTIVPGMRPNTGAPQMLANTRRELAPYVKAAALATRPVVSGGSGSGGNHNGDEGNGGNGSDESDGDDNGPRAA